ncbi:Maternal embryonic leucine zipper kinase [Geodia barretti]|uniref:non-specific serine/threonine protein kinase n=1 Tax=Geodia barretti TaxID=519541 RepID=A0AA35SH76_GEOBA|nr:Maternal embryonic leucine zipper kinase [Geodia barretti]
MSGAMSLPPNAVSFLATPTRSKRSTAFPFSPSSDFRVMYSSLKNPVKKTCSYDAQLNRIVHDPKHSLLPQSSTPQPTRKKRMGSIPGQLLKKAKRVFTPRSIRRNDQGEPRRIKGVYDVTSTSMKSPDYVLSEIERVLSDMSIEYKRKNYLLRCKYSKISTDKRTKRVEFDLEVCFIPTIDMIGVRRKRMKGDTWDFKNVCGEIFRLIHI